MVRASRKPLPRCATFAGGEEDGGAFTEEQRKYPIKMRRRICARCGLRRREHEHRADAGGGGGVGEERHLPPRKRLVLRRGWANEEPQPEEAEAWSPDAIVTRGKRAPRKKRDNAP